MAGSCSATAPDSSSTEAVRIYTLDRVAGEVAKQLIVHEQVGEGLDPEDVEYRIACLELINEDPWTWVDAGVEGNAIRILFPDDRYYGLPPFLDLEKPRRPQLGQMWRLRRPDGAAAATFILTSLDSTERKRPQWKHGDIVQALYAGKPLLARFIRATESGLALVHWDADDRFSVIPMTDIVTTSTDQWTRALEPEDVAIDF